MLVSFLASGSKGNVTLVQTKSIRKDINNNNILIDVGLSMKKINEALLVYHGIDLEDVSVVCITHRHGDHIQGLVPIINKYEHIKFIIHPKVLEDLLKEKKIRIPKDRLIEVHRNQIFGNSISVKLFELKHDVPCFGFHITDKVDGESYGHISDNGGWISEDIIAMLEGSTYLGIESNHDLTMQILDEKRDSLLKRRVLGGWGHTHNVIAFRLAVKLTTNNTKGIIFHHLSEECNTIELASRTHDELMTIWGERTRFKHVNIQYAKQNEVVSIGE